MTHDTTGNPGNASVLEITIPIFHHKCDLYVKIYHSLSSHSIDVIITVVLDQAQNLKPTS